MAKKDNREIIHGIRVLTAKAEGGRVAQSRTLVPGDEDEVAAMYTDKELKAMVERGDLAGDWKSLKKGVAAEKATTK